MGSFSFIIFIVLLSLLLVFSCLLYFRLVFVFPFKLKLFKFLSNAPNRPVMNYHASKTSHIGSYWRIVLVRHINSLTPEDYLRSFKRCSKEKFFIDFLSLVLFDCKQPSLSYDELVICMRNIFKVKSIKIPKIECNSYLNFIPNDERFFYFLASFDNALTVLNRREDVCECSLLEVFSQPICDKGKGLICDAYAKGINPPLLAKGWFPFYFRLRRDLNFVRASRDNFSILFGSGTRGCPASKLGSIILHISVTQFVDKHHWFPDGRNTLWFE